MSQILSSSEISRPLVFLLGLFFIPFQISQLDFTPKFEFDSDMCQSFANMETKLSFDCQCTLRDVADFCIENGENEGAVQILNQHYKSQSKLLGPEHEEILETLEVLAGQNLVLKNYDQSLALYWQVYKIKERTLGPTHSDTLTTLKNLAQVYHFKGNYPKAVSFLKVVYKQRKLDLGPEHVDTMEILFSLGKSLWAADQSPATKEKVLKYFSQVYKVYSRTWGENEKTLAVLSEFGKLLVTLKQFEEAFPFFRTIMKATEKTPQSELFEEAENYLGSALTELGRMEEARDVYKKAHRTKNKMGKKTPEYVSEIRAHGKFTQEVEDQINAVLNLAKVAMAEKNWEKAFQKLEEIYSIIENDHPKTEKVLQSLTKVHSGLRNFKKAFDTSVQLFHVVRQNLNVKSWDLNEKIAGAWEFAYSSYLKFVEEHSNEVEESFSPKLKEISESFISTLELRNGVGVDSRISKSVAMAASFLAGMEEIALPAASKLIKILKRTQETEPIRSDEEMERINAEIKVFQKIVNKNQSTQRDIEIQNQMSQDEPCFF